MSHGGGAPRRLRWLLTLLLAAGLSAPAAAQDGSASLRQAAKQDRPAEISRLIETGADPDREDGFGLTALLWAARLGHTGSTRALLAGGAKVDRASSVNGLTPLMVASRQGHLEIARLLLTAGAAVDRRVPEDHPWWHLRGATALTLAAESEHTDVVALLIEAGARVPPGARTDLEDRSFVASDWLAQGLGQVPRRNLISEASRRGDLAMVRLLLAAGGSAQESNALWAAASAGNVELARVLLAAGALPDGGRNPPLRVAIEKGHVEVARLLLAAGARREPQDPDNRRPFLIDALMSPTIPLGDMAMVRLLIENGIGPHQGDDPCAAAQVAASLGRAYLDLLAEGGFDLGRCWGPALGGAAGIGDLELAGWLLARRSGGPENVRWLNDAMRWVLYQRDGVEEVRWLLSRGASPAIPLELPSLEADKPRTLVGDATALARPGSLRELLAAGARPQPDELHSLIPLSSLLGSAICYEAPPSPVAAPGQRVATDVGWVWNVPSTREDRSRMVADLVAAGADLEARNRDGETPLLVAARACMPELVAALLKAGAKVDARQPESGATPLLAAARRGDSASVRLLLAAGADRNLAGSLGLPSEPPPDGTTQPPRRTAAEIAAALGFREVLAALGAETGPLPDTGGSALLSGSFETRSRPGRSRGAPAAVPFLCPQTRLPAVLQTALWPSPFAGSVSLGIALEDPENRLVERERRIFAYHLLDALALWTQACAACLPGSLALVEIGGEMYADRTCLRALAGRPVTLADFPASWCDRQIRSGRGQNPLEVHGGYGTLDDPEARRDIAQICARPRQEDAPVLGRIQSALRCPGAPPPEAAGATPYRIVIGGRETGCGDDPTLIACARPDLSVQLNAQDWTFLSNEDEHAVLGSGLQMTHLLQVLLHETGHWLGLDHTSRPGSLMADHLEADSCVGPEDIDDLARAVDLGWSERLGGYGALRGAPPAPKASGQ